MSTLNLSKEVYNSQFDILTGGSSISGFPISIRIQNQSLKFDPVFWGDANDTSLGGLKRSNIRGWNLVITLDYGLSLEPTKTKQICDGLTNLNDNQYTLRFYPDENNLDYVTMIPTSNISYKIEYRDTVRRGGPDGVVPTFELTSQRYRDTIDSFFQT